ncbi:MAG: cobyrinate a,c-diamide synthase, partial [Kiritimatiellae bacterium]|nr:cobyrinate a,c-diamide synthase [Kiritimatiellia bacterium]
GKTTLTLGLLAALKRRGHRVQPFKCGPDYIDPGHHRRACGIPSRNLDTWMMGVDGVRASFARAASATDVAVVEGVMGLFDGASADRLEGSTAHVCKLLDLPVVLAVDARAMARSIAPLVKGFAEFEPGVRLVGVIANNVSSDSHAELLRTALSAAGLPPLLGALPRRAAWEIPERHLGLVADTESGLTDEWFAALAEGIEKHVDLARLLELTKTVRPRDRREGLGFGVQGSGNENARCSTLDVRRSTLDASACRLGLARDAAFHFYYEDNLDLLRAAGVELVEFSPLQDARLPPGLAGLYLGGGFPEMFAAQLQGNAAMRTAIADFADRGGHIYAECGGLMYLCASLTDRDGKSWEMCGVLPARTRMQARLRRLGYVEAVTLRDGLFGPRGTRLRGHEFHWSALEPGGEDAEPVFEVHSASGDRAERVGLCRANVRASYVHVHFASNPAVAESWARTLAAGSEGMA